MGKIVGIDLGTTFSAIAHIDKHGKPVIIPDREGNRTTPSVIHWGRPIVVGSAAVQNAKAFPEEIVTDVKFHMGDPEFSRTFDGTRYSAEAFSAMILKKLKQDAEHYLRMEGEIAENEDITGACITVPVVFDDPARNATKNAATIAGFEEVILIDEPIASAYACFGSHSKDQKVLVVDLGGGTNDVTLLEISDTEIKVVSKNGNRKLGGRDWDKKIEEGVRSAFEAQHGIQIPEQGRDAQYLKAYLKETAVTAKHALSGAAAKTAVFFQHADKSITVDMTRQFFEDITQRLVANCTAQCEVALRNGGVEWDDVDTVLLVGGSTRMPMIREAIAEISGKKIDLPKVDPDTAVALGAAIRGDAVLNPDQSAAKEPKTELINITSKPLGIVVRHPETRKYVVDVMIPMGEEIPCDVERPFRPEEAGQESVEIIVVQGLDKDNPIDIRKLNENPHVIGNFTLKMPPGVRTDDPIQVVYKYNSDEIVEVEAIGPDGRNKKVAIETSGLTPEEVKEAARFLQRLEIV